MNKREAVKDKALCNLIEMLFLSQKKRGRKDINWNGLGCAAVMNIPKGLNTLRFISHSYYLYQLAFAEYQMIPKVSGSEQHTLNISLDSMGCLGDSFGVCQFRWGWMV